MKRDDELHELVALAAVRALSPQEWRELEDVLAERPDLRDELAELEDAAMTLADATAEAPPPSLRAGVLAAIRDVPQEAAGPAVSQQAIAPVVSIDAARRGRSRYVLAAAAAVVAVAVGVVAVNTFDGGSEAADVAEVVDADDAVTIELTGELNGLALVHSPGQEAAALVGEGIPAPRGDRVYELWLIEDEPERVDIFRPDDDGRVEVLMTDMDPAADADFAITVEPAGGTEAPTGPVVAMSG